MLAAEVAPMSVSRRQFLSGSSLAAAAWPFADLVRPATLHAAQAVAPRGVFGHGVASGDPRADRVVLWTRVSGAAPTAEVTVRWTLAANPTFTRVVARGDVPTGAARDFTVKVDVAGLNPATTYYYRFEALGARSPVGRTRTLPAATAARVRIALASCANYPYGYFNVYGRIAARSDIDVVLHLGDYIYEYEQGRYADASLTDRAVDPPHEIRALDDYRRRYALYRRDPDLQEVHRQHPFIAVWDDHEVANNTWRDGAQNHQPDEGEFRLRRDAAYQAYLEWLPVRDTGSARQPLIYRSFAVGDLADLVMLDTRIAGRDPQVERTSVLGIEDPRRTLLGPAQEGWLEGELYESSRARARWQLLGQQVMFAPQTPAGTPGGNPDSWDGYRISRSRVYDMVERHKIENLVVLTGDVHSAWGFDLPRQISPAYDPASGRGSLGVEIVCPAVSSPSPYQGPDGDARLAETPKTRPHLKFLEGKSRGYVVLDVTRERLQADWWFVPAVNVRSPEQRFGKGLVCEAGSRHLVEAGAPMATITGPDPA